MQATRKSAGEEYNKYVSHLKSVVTVVNGQLHYLNSRLRDIISNEDLDINTRYYQASSLYAQMLRLFYVIDRIHNYSDSNLTKESSNIDFIAGSASLDLVDFVDQCRHLDHHINKVNEGYLAKGKVQKAAVNQTIIDQSILWITQNNKDLVKSNISVQKFFLDSNYQSSLESLDPSESLKDKPTMKAYMEQQKNDAWQFILSNLRDAFCQDYIDTGIYPAKFSDIKMTNAISYRDFLKGAEQDITLTKLPLELSNLNEPEKLRVLEEKVTALGFDVPPEVLGNLVKNSSFKSYYVKNYMLNRTNKPYLQGIVTGLEDSYMNTVLDKISSDFDGVISEVAESSMYTLDEFSESKINYSFTDPETSGHFRFEKTACSFLSHLQISALSKNLEQKYGSDIYDSGKILREFSISDSNISSTKIDRNKYNFFMAIINETEFLRDSGYDFYVSLYKMNKEDRSELLESAADYLKSPGFLSRLQWISQMEVVAANSGDRDKRRFYKRFSEVLKMYAYAVKKVNLDVENNSKMLSKQQYMDEFTNDQDYINLHLYNSSFANFTYYYDKPSLKSLVDMDRYSYRTSMPINGVEQITTFIEGGGILDTLPVEVRSMIVSDYLLFEQRYVWQEDSHILANVLRQIDNASSKHDSEKAKINCAITNFENNDFQMDDSVIFKAIKDDDYRYLRVLLENNVSLVAKNEEGLNPLEYAIKHDNLRMVKRIIMDIDRRRQLAGNSGNFPLPLRFAIKNNSVESTPFLLEIIGVNNLSKTIMHEAVKSGNLLMVKLLLNEGVSPNNKDSSGCLPISYVPKDREDMVQLLSGKPLADIVPKKSALQSKNAIFDSKNIKKLRDVFSLYGKGANRSDLWMRRGVFILLAISISSFAAAFFYPINLLLNVAMIACYSAVILESYVSNICLPNSPKITEVMLDNTMLGVQRDEGAKVNSALLFPFISDNTNNAKSSEIINSVSSNDNDIKLLDKENFAPDNLVALDSTVRV